MQKMITQSMLILGLATSWIGFANANQDEGVYLYGPDYFRDVTCGSTVRYTELWLQNDTDDPVVVTGYDIESFGDIGGVISLLPPTSFDYDACGFGQPTGFPFTLAPYEGCEFKFVIDPSVSSPEECYEDEMDDTYTVLTGDIDDEFTVYLDAYPREIYFDFEFDMTYLGSTNSFALLGDHICNDGDDACLPVPSGENLAGVIQVSQDVAVTGEGCHHWDANCLTDDIELNGNHAYIDNTVSENAENDLAVGFWNMFNLSQLDSCDAIIDTTFNSNDLSDYPFVTNSSDSTLVYCFTGGPSVYIDDFVLFTGTVPDSKFIIILDFPEDEGYPYALSINSGAKFYLDESADPDNIFWVVNGNVEAHVESSFVGNLSTIGYVEVEDDEAGSQALFLGRILSYDNDLLLQGNAILCPNCD